MGTIIVDNDNIKNHFSDIIFSKNIMKIKKIIISSKSGKGKTSLLRYLSEQCNIESIPLVHFDFKIDDFTSELDFIEQIIYKLTFYFHDIKFSRYDKCIEDYYYKSNKNLIFHHFTTFYDSY